MLAPLGKVYERELKKLPEVYRRSGAICSNRGRNAICNSTHNVPLTAELPLAQDMLTEPPRLTPVSLAFLPNDTGACAAALVAESPNRFAFENRGKRLYSP